MSNPWIRWLKVPPLPAPEPGDEVVTPSRKQFYLDVAGWVLSQAGALFGILVSIAFLRGISLPIYQFRVGQEIFAALEGALGEVLPRFLPDPIAFSPRQAIWALEGLAILTFLVQLVTSASLLLPKFAHRVYLVGDDRVRLRDGIFTVREQTFTVANIQNVVLRQGPLQRLLGIADLEITTAGGGDHKGDDDTPNLHVGRLHSLDRAEAIRDRLRRAVEQHRHAGLGDDTAPEPTPRADGSAALLDAAAATLGAARALRHELEGRPAVTAPGTS
jgi:membrane protein YdbS with pleckstrin-like domain